MNSLATTRTLIFSAALGLTGLFALSNAVMADASVKLDVDDAKLIKLAGEASTVVVSNPMFADASIQGNKLIVIGKNTGRTKIIVLDLDGNQLANMMIKVQRAEDQVVSVYRAGQQYTFTCEPFCDQTLTVNDDTATFKAMTDQIGSKTGHSTGAASTGGNTATE